MFYKKNNTLSDLYQILNQGTTILFMLLFLTISVTTYAQDKRYLQLDFNVGVSEPIWSFRSQEMFSGRGRSIGGGFDYFFGKFGLGFNAGVFENESEKTFSDYIYHRFLEKTTVNQDNKWNTKFGMFGPIFKIGFKRFEFDMYFRGGYSQIQVPDLLFSKTFQNQSYEIYRFGGVSNDWQFAWSSGMKFIYKFTTQLGIQARADYFSTNYLSEVAYEKSYRDANDGNKNGAIDDAEYFESNRVSNSNNFNLSVVNLNLGLLFQLGRTKQPIATQMLPPMALELEDVSLIDELPMSTPEIGSDIEREIEIQNPIIKQDTEELVSVNTEESIQKSETQAEIHEELVEIPATSYDAPESKYDEEAAEFLYKAGESYFASNDFENAMPCFNKLKADPKYPRAKYMFALSLCSMGNCAEARKEYKEFAKTYNGEDKRTLEIIFASHVERCRLSGRLIPPTEMASQNNQGKGTVNKEVKTGLTYKIQFIAMKKPNADFPNLVNIGDISTEFFPNKSVYRYTLGGYNDITIASKDVYKVRKMGFRDAFLAVYENGVRVNTLYHAK
jgi:tetratricopeptide (TPR) repeat protein